ncbi:hypothetical protein [Psychrobacillus psychrodurans]|uniref:Uncharacterized protein n=1 Tax=Psychrobacillus psychrodurans TaxID=126157 RepID=A0A9X3L8W3_9BACI|nr:hypothetical protein [Psychrobacillus psychrodurans]MCZ8533540.1 hypothetical protein [Psychrobacillus psychrodurans]
MSNSKKSNPSNPVVGSVTSSGEKTSSEHLGKNEYRNQLGQLLYLDYEIADLKKRGYSKSLLKASKIKEALIEVIEQVDNPSLKNWLVIYYIDKEVNRFDDDCLRQSKSRYLSKFSYYNKQDVEYAETAKMQIYMVLNNQIVLTNEELEKCISNLVDSLNRIILRKFLFDKKSYEEIAGDISPNTFRQTNRTTNEKSPLNKSTVGRRINTFKNT